MGPNKRLKALQQEKADIVQRMEALLDAADEGLRDLTGDEEKDYEELEALLPTLDKRIQREQNFLNAQASQEPIRDLNRDTRQEAAARIGEIHDNWQDDPMCGYERPRDFLLDVIEVGQGGEASPQLRFLAAAGSDEQGGYSDPHGGFFVPEGMAPQVLTVDPEVDPTAGRMTQVPMTAQVVKTNARVDKDHRNSVSGGLVVSRRAQTQTGDSSRTEYEQVKLEATALFGVAFATEQVLERSPVSFAAILDAGFRDEFGSKGMAERRGGTGTGGPLGVLNSPAKISVAKEGAQAADTINGTNIVKMRKRCWRYGQAIWLANHDTYEQLLTAHVTGTNDDVFLFNPARGVDVPDTLLGRPIFFTEYAKMLGDEGDLILAVWSQYLWGTLGSPNPRRAESVHVRFLNHERTFKFWLENDGQPWWRSTLIPKHSTETLSPVVVLAERA